MNDGDGPHLILIGYRGSGKTTVGRRLAERLDRPFVDTDDLVEAAAGRSIRDIFEREGEPAFRALEAHAIREVTARDRPHVVSVGGGAVLAEENRRALSAAGVCVWLTAPVETLHRRIAADERTGSRRPALTTLPAIDEIQRLLAAREPAYAELAAERVDTCDLDPDTVAESILRRLNLGHGH